MKNKDYYDLKRQKIRTTLGQIIRRNRRIAKVTQEELAGVLGVTKGSISRYEKGTMELAASALPVISEVCGFTLKEYIKPLDADRAMERLEQMIEYRKRTGCSVCEDRFYYGNQNEALLREEAVQELSRLDDGETVSFINNVNEVVTYMQQNNVDYAVKDDLVDFTIECVSQKVDDKSRENRLGAYLKRLVETQILSK